MGYNKDFYTKIPLWIQNKLDMKLLLYRDELWFSEAWRQYREHCIKTKIDLIEDPDYFFIKKEKELNEMKASDEGDGFTFSDDSYEGEVL